MKLVQLKPSLERKNFEIKRGIETIQITALLEIARIFRRVQETCSNSNFSERLPTNTSLHTDIHTYIHTVHRIVCEGQS